MLQYIRPTGEIGPRPRTRKRKVFSILVVISLVGTISGKSLKLLPPDIIFLKLKCTKFDFGWGSAPDPTAGANSAPPDPLAGFKGAYF